MVNPLDGGRVPGPSSAAATRHAENEVVVSSRRTLILIGAIVLGVVAALLVFNYVRGVENRANGNAKRVDVYVAKSDIARGTPGETAVSDGAIGKAQIPQEFRPASAITTTDEVSQKVALFDIPQNSPIVQGMFVDPAKTQISFRERLKNPQHVAISVSVDQVRGVAGFLVPGDEVNLMVFQDNTGARGDLQTARYLYQKVQILAVGQSTLLTPGEQVNTSTDGKTSSTSSSQSSASSGVITFNVPAEAAQWIASAQQGGGLYLSLVGPRLHAQAAARPSTRTRRRCPGEDPAQLTPYGPAGRPELGAAMNRPYSGQPGEGLPLNDVSFGGGGGAKPDVAVVDVDQPTRSRLAMQIGNGATAVETLGELSGALGGAPTVVVLGPSFADGRRPRRGRAAPVRPAGARGHHGHRGALAPTSCSGRCGPGSRTSSSPRSTAAQLDEAIDRVGRSLGSGGRPADPDRRVEDEDGELGRVVMVFSTKGGSGKSVIASNLAVLLAQRSEKPVVLVDADLQFGDIAVMLKLTPQHTIVDAVSALDRLDSQLLRELLSEHSPEGLLVLPGARSSRRSPTRSARPRWSASSRRCAPSPATSSSTRPPTSTTWCSGSSRSATTCCSWPAWTSPTSRTSRSACRPSGCSTRRWRSSG